MVLEFLQLAAALLREELVFVDVEVHDTAGDAEFIGD